VVTSKTTSFYFDMAYSKPPREDGFDWAGFVGLGDPSSCRASLSPFRWSGNLAPDANTGSTHLRWDAGRIVPPVFPL